MEHLYICYNDKKVKNKNIFENPTDLEKKFFFHPNQFYRSERFLMHLWYIFTYQNNKY